MNENRQDYSALLERLDLYSILRDCLRNLWAIVLVGLCGVNQSVAHAQRIGHATFTFVGAY